LKHKTLNIERMMIVEQMLKNVPNPLLHIADVSGSALFNADCMDILPLIPDKSVQLILADLPYGTTANKWDSVLDLNKLWIEYERIITDNGAIILTATQPFTTQLISSNLKLFKYEIIWVKSRPNGHLEAKNKPMRKHENILIFSKGASANGCKNRITYNPQGLVKVDRYNKNSTDTDNYGSRKSRPVGLVTKQEYTNYPTTIWAFGSEGKTIHPTQKPLSLMKEIIATYSNENDMVLDNTMGVGTTCLGAKELNRKFIGIEKEVKYYNLAVARVFG
jgi:site-specific DNA-methyltransferase (adenine-specific)